MRRPVSILQAGQGKCGRSTHSCAG